jgi:hypothetical protein
MTATKQTYDEDKFKELILYIADRMGDAQGFGATMLNKVLYFADFFYYAEHGQAITGAEYQRLDYGPAPKRLLPARDALIAEGRAAIRTTAIGPYNQNRIEPLVDPDIAAFSAEEIKMVDEVIALLRGSTAVGVSQASHRMMGWKAAETGETIPYETVFLTKTAVSKDDMKVALEIKQQLAA